MNRIIKRVLLTFIISVSFAFIFINLNVKAAVEINDITNEELYNETNTYKYTFGNVINKETYEINNKKDYSYQARYDLNSRNNQIVDTEDARITVFTHGWTGSRKDWINENFIDKSLVTKLEKVLSANVYSFSFDMNKDNNIYFYIERIIDGKPYSSDLDLIDFSKQVIILFNGLNTGYDNDYIYTQFNYMMSVLLYTAKSNNNDILPKVNLIGHSRGGLTNMQYALDHPDLVDNMYSFGTPYIGTTTSGLDREYFNGAIGHLFMGNDQRGEWDLSNEDAYGTYVKRWNDDYDKYYSHINLIALGTVTSLLYLLDAPLVLIDMIPFMQKLKDACSYFQGGDVLYELIKASVVFFIAKFAVNTAIPAIGGIVTALYSVSSFLNLKEFIAYSTLNINSIIFYEATQALMDEKAKHLLDLLKGIEPFLTEGLPNLLSNEIKRDGQFLTWQSDIAVNLDSQMGKGTVNGKEISYKGMYSKYNVCLPTVHKPNQIPHIKELEDSELHNVVVKDFENRQRNKKIWTYSFNDDYTLSINGYYGDVNSNNGILNIPSSITIGDKSYLVTKIGDNAFNPECYSTIEDSTVSDIKTINVPYSVKTIGESAFANLKNLENVNFTTNSNLEKIEKCAFSNSSITNITIPNNIKRIEDGAFANSNLKNITINGNLSYLGSSVFKNCNIESFSSLSNYLNYSNGIITKDYGKTLTYAKNNITNLVVPNGVETIDYNTFEESIIESINLNNVKNIYGNAFTLSNLETISGGDYLEEADIESFIGTPYYDNIGDKLVVGKVLLYDYTDEDIYVVDEGIERIGSEAIHGTSKKVIISASVTTISNDAFTNLKHLEEVYFTSNEPAYISSESFNSNVKLIIPSEYYSIYSNNIEYKNYSLDRKTIKIKYYEGNNLKGEYSYYYGELLNKYPTRARYDIVSILGNEGNEYSIGQLIYFIEDTNLYIIYEQTKYELNFIVNDDVLEEQYNYGDHVNISIPKKKGFYFIGWYDENNNLIINQNNVFLWNNINSNNINLTAKFKAYTYSIDYELNDAEAFGEFKYSFTFEEDKAINYSDLPIVKKFGYEFIGWYVQEDNELFATTYYYDHDIVLVAMFSGKLVDSKEETINDRYTIINVQPIYKSILGILQICTKRAFTYNIKSNCKKIAFISNNEEITLKIIVEYRTDGLTIAFNDVNAIGETGYDLIDSFSSTKCQLIVEYKGTVNLRGGQGFEGNIGYSNSSTAIKGATGSAGGTGSIGSKGKRAIYASSVNFQNYDSESFLRVFGGNGGTGGKGGAGQTGGEGERSPYGSIISSKKGDDGMRGGNGGNGGRGGQGGNGSQATNSYNVYGYGGIAGQGGQGGTEGSGGEGGRAGTLGGNGKKGSTGGSGNRGSNGLCGMDGYYQEGNPTSETCSYDPYYESFIEFTDYLNQKIKTIISYVSEVSL